MPWSVTLRLIPRPQSRSVILHLGFYISLTTVSILVGQGCYPVGWLELSSPTGLSLSRPQLYTNGPLMVIMGTGIPERHPRGSLGSRGTHSCPCCRAATWLLVVIRADCPCQQCNSLPCLLLHWQEKPKRNR